MAEQDGWIHYEVVNWEKYNPRVDRKGHSWFRIENAIATDPKFFGLSAAQRWVAICLFAEVSKNCGDPVKFPLAWAADCFKAKPEDILKAFQLLVTNGVLRLPGGNQVVTDRGIRTDGRTDERTNETGRGSDPDGSDTASPSDLMSLWNRNCGQLPKAEKLTEGRKRSAQSRLREQPELSYWEKVLERIRRSSFCNHGGKDRPWQADFDWFLKPETHVRVLEGKYDDRGSTGGPPGEDPLAKFRDPAKRPELRIA